MKQAEQKHYCRDLALLMSHPCIEGSTTAGLVGSACGACLAMLHMHCSSCSYRYSYPLKCCPSLLNVAYSGCWDSSAVLTYVSSYCNIASLRKCLGVDWFPCLSVYAFLVLFIPPPFHCMPIRCPASHCSTSWCGRSWVEPEAMFLWGCRKDTVHSNFETTEFDFGKWPCEPIVHSQSSSCSWCCPWGLPWMQSVMLSTFTS